MLKAKYNILTFLGFLVLGGLFAFTNHRNTQRKVTPDKVIFTSINNLLVSEDSVNKLLIQKHVSDSIQTKETLALDTIESRLKTVPHIKNAQAYMSVNGLVSTNITPRKAIGRIYSSSPRYIDDEGIEMPLVNRYAERVPLVYNYKSKSKKDLVFLLNKIETTSFLKQQVVGVYCEPNLKFRLKIRDYTGNIELGTIEKLNLKFKNFNGFYAKAIKDQLFKKYRKINLEITNQVVCTK